MCIYTCMSLSLFLSISLSLSLSLSVCVCVCLISDLASGTRTVAFFDLNNKVY